MATQTMAAHLGDIKQLGADGGISLSTTVARTFIPPGTRWISLTPRNFATGVVAQVRFNPWLTVLKTTDDLLTAANLTNYSDEAQDNSTGTSVTLSSQGTGAQGDALYVGADYPFSGVAIDVDGANGNASVLTVNYWNGSAWTDSSDTDGTASGGATLAVDGSVTWTIPTAWVKASLYDIQNELDSGLGDTMPNVGILQRELFWTQWVVSAALDSAVTLDSMLAIRAAADYFELQEGQAFEQALKGAQPGGFASFDALMNAGTGNLVATASGRFSPVG